MTKQITPSHVGEHRTAPVRTLLALRAWAVWRARQGGWADAQTDRKNRIDEQERAVERDVRALDEPSGLLGHWKVDAFFRKMLPVASARLVANAAAAAAVRVQPATMRR